MKHFNLSRWALDHQPLMRFLMAVLVLGGIFSYYQLGQDEDPPFTFRAMLVQTFWPGATPTQMADLVADKLEKQLQQVQYVNKIRTYTKAGEALTIIEAQGTAPPKEIPNVWYQVRKKMGDTRGSLPPGVIGPVFNDEFGDTYGVMYSLTADGFTTAELKDYAERVRQQLLRVKDVNKVELFGVQDDKIFIEVSHQKLAQLGIDVNSLSNQLNGQNSLESSGVVVLPTDNVSIRVTGNFNSLDDIKALPVRAGNNTIKLSDFATVTRGTIDPPRSTMRSNGKPVIGLGISMVRGGDIIVLGKALERAEKIIQTSLPVGIEMQKVADQPRAVATSVGEFVRVLIEAVVIVLAVSFLSLGLHTKPLRIDARPGLVVGLTIPLVLAITFLCMKMLDINLHKISLGALIIALGLLVDDAIIAVEMMVRKLEEGYDKVAAATFAYETTAIPMLTGTLITAAGFVPVGLAKSVAGEYTYSIFAVTALALVISWFAAVLFVPLLGVWILKVKPHGEGGSHELFNTPFYNRFRALVDWSVAHRWLVIGITALCLVLGVLGFGKIEKQFFPDSSRPELVVDMWLPEGSSYNATFAESARFEQWLSQQAEVVSYLTYVGTGSPRFYLPMDQIFPQANVAQLIVTPKDLPSRNALRLKIQALFRADFPNVRGRVKLLPNGPPVPYPVQFRVQGPDAKIVRSIADQVKDIMRQNANTVGVNDNWNEQVKVLKLEIDQDKARALGVSTQLVQRAAQTILSGTVIGQYRERDRAIDIVLRQPLDERDALSKLADANIPTASGRYIPISQVVKAQFEWEPGVIWRENRDFAITVQSDVQDGIQGPTVTAQVDAKLAELRATLTGDYVIKVAGATESSTEAQVSIMAYLPLMMFIVLTLLMLQLHSFGRTMLVYLTGPLGIIGAAATLLLFNAPFGFVAQLGVIALLGMIIRNSVILIDQIEHDIANGVHAWTAVVESAVRRCRPIVLTAAAAVLAMIPLSRSVFWGPMAVAIMGGLIVATVLTLVFFPALYAAAFRIKRPPA